MNKIIDSEIAGVDDSKKIMIMRQLISEQLSKLRDKNDKNRQSSPLIKTKDSLFIDTTNISEKEVLEIAIQEIKKKIDFI